MLLGDTFVFKSGSDKFHLWIVISDPLINSDDVLLVNLTTVRGVKFEDLSCVFDAGEHEWIVAKSYIDFSYARFYSNAHLDRIHNGTTVRVHASFPPHLLRRIHDGAAATQNLELGYLDLLRDQGFA